MKAVPIKSGREEFAFSMGKGNLKMTAAQHGTIIHCRNDGMHSMKGLKNLPAISDKLFSLCKSDTNV